MQDSETTELARAGHVVAGKFRLDACIGQGGMGSVWSATHLGLGHQIAIKLISREFARSPEALRRFDAEAKAAARLQSRHVVQVHDNGTLEDGTPYIAMELLSGESLQQRIDRAGPLSVAETVNVLAQCCKALGRAHAVGIVHRDIKPDNIFLSRSPDEEGYVVKVLDFGVAKISLGGGDQSATKTGAVLGTPLYMSPEQARGLKNVDHRTDLYSLGIVAYTMLTGRVAFYGESFGDILLKICTEPLPSLRLSANVPAGLDIWLQRVCARDPGNRCASAQEFIDTLRAATGRAGSSPGVDASSGATPAVAPTLADSDAPWRLPPSPPAQSLAEANVAITAAGVPRKNHGVAIVVSLFTGLILAATITFFALSRSADPRSAGPAHASQPADSLTPSPSTVLVAPPPEPALALPRATAIATAAPPATSASVWRAMSEPTAEHAAAAPRPPAPPRAQPPAPESPPASPASKPPSKPTPAIDLGY
jgi:eukaryotic-like serine/threonine-protein kinase